MFPCLEKHLSRQLKRVQLHHEKTKLLAPIDTRVCRSIYGHVFVKSISMMKSQCPLPFPPLPHHHHLHRFRRQCCGEGYNLFLLSKPHVDQQCNQNRLFSFILQMEKKKDLCIRIIVMFVFPFIFLAVYTLTSVNTSKMKFFAFEFKIDFLYLNNFVSFH